MQYAHGRVDIDLVNEPYIMGMMEHFPILSHLLY
jgi:hypothetical protein